jgi:hypothetical protein
MHSDQATSATGKPTNAIGELVGSSVPVGALADVSMDDAERRDEFLRQMYSEMWNNINRHLTVTWQAVGVLAGGFAVFFGLAERQAISVDMTS